jgi:hypothetical protein
MPGVRIETTEITEIVTGLGTLGTDLETVMAARPKRLHNVSETVWDRVASAYEDGRFHALFSAAFENGLALLTAQDGLRRRPPRIIEWKGLHRPPGSDVTPTDLRIDHVYQVSCKYDSKIMQNSGPSRLFDHLLAGEQRARADWFATVAPAEYQAFYAAARDHLALGLPKLVAELNASHRAILKEALRPRLLPESLRNDWSALCTAVAEASALRIRANLSKPRARLRFLWRLLRIGDAPYFILGVSGASRIRLRVASAWDWMQDYELRALDVAARPAGQPEVAWRAKVRSRRTNLEVEVAGHVEIRWSHGRFQGAPEAKVYLDTEHSQVPGFFALR